MRGLIRKEFLMTKSVWRSWILAFIVLGGYSVMFRSGDSYYNTGMIYVWPVIAGMNGTLNSFYSDSRYQWNLTALTMPVRRREIVFTKYIYMYLLDLVTGAIATALVILGDLAGIGTGLAVNLLIGGGIMLTLLMLQALMVPIPYRFGPERASVLCVVLALSPLLLLAVPWGALPSIPEPTDVQVLRVEGMLILPVLLMNLLSVWVSVRIYEGKEY